MIALLLASVDTTVGVWLLWYARAREQRRREPVAITGVLLLGMAVFLGWVAWKVGHRHGLLPVRRHD